MSEVRKDDILTLKNQAKSREAIGKAKELQKQFDELLKGFSHQSEATKQARFRMAEAVSWIAYHFDG